MGLRAGRLSNLRAVGAPQHPTALLGGKGYLQPFRTRQRSWEQGQVVVEVLRAWKQTRQGSQRQPRAGWAAADSRVPLPRTGGQSPLGTRPAVAHCRMRLGLGQALLAKTAGDTQAGRLQASEEGGSHQEKICLGPLPPGWALLAFEVLSGSRQKQTEGPLLEGASWWPSWLPGGCSRVPTCPDEC